MIEDLVANIKELSALQNQLNLGNQRLLELQGVQKYLAEKWLEDSEFESLQAAFDANHEGIADKVKGL